jgi:mitochondrial fission protein ELM1
MPVVWLIDAYRAGERGQVRALADALGWPTRTHRLDYRGQVLLPHLLGRSTLRGVTSASRAELGPPWPDLVISCGVRNEPVCRWIRARSGGRTRYVHIGRPWGPLDQFDLVITTPQYRIPQRSNVLHNQLTLHGVTPERLAEARGDWAERFEYLPLPRVTVLVGGDSGPFTLGPRAAARLAGETSRLALQLGGSLLVTTSSRTAPAAVEALQASLQAPHFLHCWRPGEDANPYLGMLAWADRLVVTGDSIAMLSEACATGKPVAMFDLGGMREGCRQPADFRCSALLYRALMRWGWKPLSRDITRVHQALRDSGRAHWLGETVETPPPPASSGDMARAIRSVKALLGEA